MTTEKLQQLQKQLANMQENIRSLHAEIETEKSKPENWHLTKDKLFFEYDGDSIEIECNYESWEWVKENKILKDILYVEINDDGSPIGLGVNEMKDLQQYLTKIINYLGDK